MSTTSTAIKAGTSPNQITFTGGQVKKASVTQQIDKTSFSLPSSTLDFTLFSATGGFDIVNPGGIYAILKKKEIVDAYETVDGIEIYLGRFYLDDWDVVSRNEMTFTCIDAIQLIDSIVYNGGLFLDASLPGLTNPINSEDLIAAILDPTGISYDLDSDLEGIELKGYVPSGSSRVALQHALIAMNAYATCSHSSQIKILPFALPVDSDADLVLSNSKIGQNPKIVRRKEVTAVEVDYFNYTATVALDTTGDGNSDVNMKKIFVGSIAAGEDYLFLIDPDIARGYSIHGTATVSNVVSTPTYYSFHCTGSGTFELWMEGFFKQSKLPYIVSSSSNYETSILVDEASLVDLDVVEDVAQNLYDYLQLRYKSSPRTFGLGGVEVGKIAWVDTSSPGRKLLGVVEKATLNLSHGFTSELEIVGDVYLFDDTVDVLYPGKHDDDHPGLNYSGSWVPTVSAGSYGGNHEQAGVYPAEVSFVFYGSQFTLVYYEGAGSGQLVVWVDGVNIGVLDQSGSGGDQAEWASDTYDLDYHTVKLTYVENTGTVYVDAVEITGYFLPGKYDDRAFQYLWDNDHDTLTTYAVGFLNTQTPTLDTPQSYLEVDFYGAQVRIGYIAWNDVNDLSIQIDGGSTTVVDTNSGLSDKIPIIWTSDELDLDTHTLKIWGGGGGGEYILLDFIEFLLSPFISEFWAWETGDDIEWETNDTMEVYK